MEHREDDTRRPDLTAPKGWASQVPGSMEAAAKATRMWAELGEAFRKAFQPVLDRISVAYKDAEQAYRAIEVGWVPFPGLPAELIDKAASDDEVHAVLAEYTQVKWPAIRDRLHQDIVTCGVDDEAIATFEEALRAHEAGLYRSVVRVLFPEIERVARETVYGGHRREAPVGKRPKGNMITSLSGFREIVMQELPAGVVLGPEHGLAIIRKMHAHLYEPVDEDEASLARFRADPVPNRHASMHAFVPYSSRQNSLNALFMTRYIFELIMKSYEYIEASSGFSFRKSPLA